ncbi:MAG: hypothetical protein JWP66_1049, partial [Naasia sp.]|nr:hypothetical protein [Naasia sp.]
MAESAAPERPDPHVQAMLRFIPGVGKNLAHWRDDVYVRDRERVERMSAAAADDVDLGDLLEAMEEDERISDLFRSAVEGAIKTGDDDKIRLLGRALASGALSEDDAALEEAEQLLRIAVELDPVDLRALLLLAPAGRSGLRRLPALRRRGQWDRVRRRPRRGCARRPLRQGPT